VAPVRTIAPDAVIVRMIRSEDCVLPHGLRSLTSNCRDAVRARSAAGAKSHDRLLGLATPLIEPGTIRPLGAEVVQFVVEPEHAAAGVRVRELGLPRDALLNLIIRDDQALPPRGSTLIEAGDHLHILVRQEAALDFGPLLERWRHGPLGAPRPRRPPLRGVTIFTTRPWTPADGDPAHPTQLSGQPVVEQLRTRRDQPGALVALADGRYAYTAPIAAVGSARQLQQAARHRLSLAPTDTERAWRQEVIGALTLP
jgi:potassium/hydrogen antiporter